MKDRRIDRTAVVALVAVLAIAAIGVYVAVSGSGGAETEGGGGDFSAPKNTVQTYYEAFNDRDAEKAYDCLSSELREYYTKSWMEDRIDFFEDFEFQHTIQDFTEVSVSGEQATVQFELEVTRTNPEEENVKSMEFELVKSGGEWKINQIIEL